MRELTYESIAYWEKLYEDFRRNRAEVDPTLARFFAEIEGDGGPGRTRAESEPVAVGVYGLVQAYRELGHLAAELNPLGGNPTEHPLLDLGQFGFRPSDLDRIVPPGGFRGLGQVRLRDLLGALRETYCRTVGVEYSDLPVKEEREWLQEQMEPCRNRPALSAGEKRKIFERLLVAESFEKFLQLKYPTQKRFSLEGGESLIPLLDTLVETAANEGAEEIVIGMAHRGRLNVLAHVLRKPVEMILAEFEGTGLAEDAHGDGDVKYHQGFSHDHTTESGRKIHLSLSPNPSHLEWVDPVVEGIVRAKQEHLRDTERRRVVPLLIHGDAAFTGQGIVAETLMLSGLRGFRTGGTIHVILNNQIGFTTPPENCRATPYASDLAKTIRVPVFHVNADDPEAVVHVARLAARFRQKFRKDVIIDLVCYRRHGHNELDDPTYTQPVLYKKIAEHPTVRTLYEARLVAEGVLDPVQVEDAERSRRELLEAALEYARQFRPRQQVFAFGGLWQGLGWASGDWGADTAVPREVLEKIVRVFERVPDGFRPHPRLLRLMRNRARMLEGEGRVDWACAEALAIGSLLLEKRNVRLCGQDSGRGTFSQRHAVWYDYETGEPYVPLDHIAPEQGRFEVVDSPLSEAGVLGFEYGMSLADPHRLVLWEAQYGDFCNVAQVFIDQFLASAESKWHRMSGIVLLLPHGYEGQGPEHSSARLERFLQLCAEENLQVANPTTPAQYFHVLRRQLARKFRKPLVLMTPKSLLRHPLVVSPVREFTDGCFRTVLDDPEVHDPARVRRLILCSGKVFYTLLEARRGREVEGVALVRLEQLYPFPSRELAALLERYRHAAEVFWVQEEPRNMGAWQFVRDRIGSVLGDRPIVYVGRDEAASPATGVYAVHEVEEAELVRQALGGDAWQGPVAMSGGAEYRDEAHGSG
ncbi:MAG: 2-oxoglutarate dehydrogenase subunit E1 [Candidatus Binatia bacterium]|nr:MAG: 2-oxoglutarate dehydrogenase subunit E1 [Candidatus Binatia bacterium]